MMLMSPQLRGNVITDLNRDHDNNNCIYDDTQNNNNLYDPTPEQLDGRVSPIGADWPGELCSPTGSLPGMGYSYTYRELGLIGHTSLDKAGFDFDYEFMNQWLLICDLHEG